MLPGAGLSVASFLSYSIEKKASAYSKEFGNGAIEGVARPESANNAAAQTAFIPTLALGIPDSTTMALVLGAMVMLDSVRLRLFTEFLWSDNIYVFNERALTQFSLRDLSGRRHGE